MMLDKAFYVETQTGGGTRIYRAGRKFFPDGGKPDYADGRRANPEGLMESFGPADANAKNAYLCRLKKDGWIPLSHEDVKKISVNERGVITAYPFKYRKGYIALDKIETAAREQSHIWESADHHTNPFSALKDYSRFVSQLAEGGKYDAKPFSRQLAAFADRIRNIGAIDVIEDFFTAFGYVPDPRRFNKTVKELWRYYNSHLADCCRVMVNECFFAPGGEFSVDPILAALYEIRPLLSFVSDKAYEQWVKGSANG